jgi:hypothetical protein
MGRMEYVIKTYWGKSVGKGDNKFSLNCIVLDTFEIAISLVGAEASVPTPDRIINHDFGSLQDVGFRTNELNIERIQKSLDMDDPALGSYTASRLAAAKAAKAVLARLGQPYEYDAQGIINWDGEQWGLADLVHHVVRLPDHSPVDFLIPWVGRELSKLAKASVDAMSHSAPAAWREFRKDYSEACDLLKTKAPAIAQWSKETRTDVGRVDLAQALEAIATYKFKTSPVEQGTVVYQFNDGWTVQELRTERALEQEGKNMQNCVGGYCEEVEGGDVRIYSIRDVGGNPHVTMELKGPPAQGNDGWDLSPEEFATSEKRLRWHFAQILGKQNDAPTAEYRDRAREFIDKVFDKEGIGWCVAGGSAKLARLTGRQLEKIDFVNILSVNGAEDDLFAGADFSYANLARCDFAGLGLEGSSFEAARLMHADLTGSQLYRAKLDRAVCHFTRFKVANLEKTTFDGAHLGGADFTHARLKDASFKDARVDGTQFDQTDDGRTASWTSVALTSVQKRDLGLPMSDDERASVPTR